MKECKYRECVQGLNGTGIFICELLNHPVYCPIYKGKTTLEITYKDGVPIDTVVVFKNKR